MLRPAVPEDASRLAEIQIFAKRTAFRPIFQNDFVSFQEMQVLDLALFYRDEPGALEGVFVYDDGIVKAMTKWEKGGADSRCWELKEVYVDPFFQHQGIGAFILEEFLKEAAQAGIRRATLWVLEKNEPARALYSRYGFAPNGNWKLQEGTVEVLVEYERDFSHLCVSSSTGV